MGQWVDVAGTITPLAGHEQELVAIINQRCSPTSPATSLMDALEYCLLAVTNGEDAQVSEEDSTFSFGANGEGGSVSIESLCRDAAHHLRQCEIYVTIDDNERETLCITVVDGVYYPIRPYTVWPEEDILEIDLRLYAAMSDPSMRQVAAVCASSPADLLTTLADDPDHLVRAKVAANPRCPVGALTTLVTDSHPRVRRLSPHRICTNAQ